MNLEQRRHKFDLSYTSIIRIIVVLAVLGILFLIRDIVALVFISIFFAAAIMPWVNWFHEKWKFPRAASVAFIYLIAFAVISLVVILIIPPLSAQIQQIVISFPEFFQKVFSGLSQLQGFSEAADGSKTSGLQDSLSTIQSTLAKATQGVFDTISSIFGSVIFAAAVLVLTLYLIVEENALMAFIREITPNQYHNYLADFAVRAQTKLGKWLRGQLLLMLFVGVLTYIGLLIIGLLFGGMEFALVLALIAGLLELIPYAGPILSAIPAIIVGLSISPLTAVAVVILYFLVQQIENNLLLPKIMERAVGLNPVITIIVVLIGAKLAGIVGAILAVPVTTIGSMFLRDLYDKRHLKSAKADQ